MFAAKPLVDLFFAPQGLPGAIALRPIRREDGPALGRFIQSLSCDSRRQRFHALLSGCSSSMLELLTAIDGRRHVAFVATLPAGEGSECIVAEARYVVTHQGDSAEFAVVVADDWQGRGLADALMDALIAQARTHGLTRLFGEVRPGNGRMLAFMRRRGFAVTPACEACHREDGTSHVEQRIEPLPVDLSQHHAVRLAGVLRRWLQPHSVLPGGRLPT